MVISLHLPDFCAMLKSVGETQNLGQERTSEGAGSRVFAAHCAEENQLHRGKETCPKVMRLVDGQLGASVPSFKCLMVFLQSPHLRK